MHDPSSTDHEAAGWFFENALDVFLIVRNGDVLQANPAWTALSGWTVEQTIGRSHVEFVHPDDVPLLAQMITQLDAEGAAICEHRIRTRGGVWLWVRTRGRRAADGRTLVAIQDITAERERLAEDLQAARVGELLGLAAGVYIWRFDSRTQTYDLNTLARSSLPQDEQLSAAAEIQQAIHPEDQAGVAASWAHTLASGEGAMLEYRVGDSQAGWRRLRTAWRGVRPSVNGAWDVLGISQDVTELTEARDAALAAAEAKSQFLANMSHEIRTPMNGVLGVLHILRAQDPLPDHRELLEQALASGATLAQLLNDIIDFAKMEQGRLELTPEPVDLSGVMDAVASMLRPEAESRGLYLHAEAAPGVGWAEIDPIRLRQMLFNLAGNAVKFTRKGGVRLVLTTRGERVEQLVRIEVHDTGVGIAEAAQSNLFDLFHQADGSSTRQFGGSGLGLAVTKALVRQMGGRIGFNSREGEGSCFWIEAPAPACRPPEAAGPEASRWLEGLRVLVVEDNPTNRLVATRMLGTWAPRWIRRRTASKGSNASVTRPTT